MLQKWKILIANWINCYFEDEDKKEKIDIDTLVDIISHLRENLNFDESKSSVLRAHTVKEFILEKYPQFKFENGTLNVTNEEEVYLAASLLLFFVCVNSKEIDIKTAMCSRLSTEDQKTILKYSKCLMDCPSVTCRDVQAAILEACGQDTASMMSSQLGIIDTPPALRSLHSEVRRLQAALDAERFDRNYLQEELARKNLKMDKLMKIREQYKLEIMDLKAKISLCGQDDKAKGSECETDKSLKLMKQLKEIEDRLEHTQTQLDDVLYERDMYKSKVEDLKKDRDKWLLLSQEETDRVLQLTQELETERNNSQSLKEVLAELRQHNRLNGLDLSQLECDDPETSIRSLQNNTSGCSEVCANVIEVQLCEERANIVVLKQQIETLQGQINDLKTVAASEKFFYEEMLKEKESEVNNLKHRINEEFEKNNNLNCLINNEIEEKNTLKLRVDEEVNNKNILEVHFNHEVIRLNNEVNELEQKLKDNTENSRKIIETKFNEIHMLQEEKMSLLESFTNEINKRDNMLTDLQSDLENEKQSKTSMKDSYENKIMKLNEKVLNRNNELVELQNNVCEKSEMIESLHFDLQKVRESKQELIEKYTNDLTQLATDRDLIQEELYDKSTKAEQLLILLNEKDAIITELKHDLETLKVTVHELTENCKSLEAIKTNLLHDLEACKSKFEETCNDLSNLEKSYREENVKYAQTLDERNAIIDALKLQLQNEIEFKIDLQNNMSLIAQNKICLDDEVHTLKNLLEQKEKALSVMEINLQKQVYSNEMLINEKGKLKAQLEKHHNVIESLKAQLESLNNNFNEQLNEKSKLIEELNNRILQGIREKNIYEDKIKTLNNEKYDMDKEIARKSEHIKQLQAECDKLTQITEQNKLAIKTLEQNIEVQNKKCLQLEKNFDVSTSKMILKLNETEKAIKCLCDHSKKALNNKDELIQSLMNQVEKLEKNIESNQVVALDLVTERDKLIHSVEREKIDKDTLEKEYRNRCIDYEKTIEHNNTEIFKLRTIVDEKSKEIATLNNIISQNTAEIKQLESKLGNLESHVTSLVKTKTELTTKLKEEIALNHALDTEKNALIKTNQRLVHENTGLLNDKAFLTQELSEERNVRKITVEETNALKTKLDNEVEIKRGLLNVKECITQQLVEEKSLRDILENEKETLFVDKELLEQKLNVTQQQMDQLIRDSAKEYKELIDEKHVLIEKMTLLEKEKYVLEKEYGIEKSAKGALQTEKNKLNDELKEIKDFVEIILKDKNELSNEKDNLLQQISLKEENIEELIKKNETLIATKQLIVKEKENISDNLLTLEHIKNELLKEKSNLEITKDTLINDNSIVVAEKEMILKDLEIAKVAKDKLESENSVLTEQLKTLNENYDLEIKNKNRELVHLEKVLSDMIEKFKIERDINEKIKSTLNTILKKLKSDINNQEMNNEVLYKLINADISNLTCMGMCNLLSNITETLTNEVYLRVKLEKALVDENCSLAAVQDVVKQKESQIVELQTEIKKLQQTVHEVQLEICKQSEDYTISTNSKIKDIEFLQKENQDLYNELQDVKLQLEKKVYSLKEKLTDNENVTDKLKNTYESQIDNLNLMITKLTSYLKDKTLELEGLRKDKDQLTANIEENRKVIKSLEDEVKVEKQKNDQLITDFESECLVLKNMVTITESVMEDEKISLKNIIEEHVKTIEVLQEEIKSFKNLADTDMNRLKEKIKEKEMVVNSLLKELSDVKDEKDKLIKKVELEKHELNQKVVLLSQELREVNNDINKIISEKNDIGVLLETYKDEKEILQKCNDELKIRHESEKFELEKDIAKLCTELKDKTKIKTDLELTVKEQAQHNAELVDKLETVEKEFNFLKDILKSLESEKSELLIKLERAKREIDENKINMEQIDQLKENNMQLLKTVQENEAVILNLKYELEQNEKMFDEISNEKKILINKQILLQEDKNKIEEELHDCQKKVNALMTETETLKEKLFISEQDLIAKDGCIVQISKEKDTVISSISKELLDEKTAKEKFQLELEKKTILIYELQQNLEELNCDRDALDTLKKENEELMKAVQQRETLPCQEKLHRQQYSGQLVKDHGDQVYKDLSSDITQSSSESLKTISDLEKIIHDKNRTITALQSDITFLKSIVAESETKLLDATREQAVSSENCQQLSSQLKKIVYQKNEEIAELKRQVNKMSATENRASQIIKVSAKYQAIILKRIAEIKSNTVLKELTNYGNSNTCDNELRRSLNAGTITMEDLENFLETTDKHLKRCSEKQLVLQKERDRLYEVNRIHESEIINLKKFLTELSVSFQTFNSVKDLYTQKLSRVVSIQRTVRREILNLDGHVTDSCMCKLERGYAAVMQDLAECTMNLERWVERCVSRTVSVEKIKQAFSDNVSVSGNFQSAGLEVQLEELEKSFQRLLEEVARAQRGEGARDAQSVTVMEVKAEYEDKLNRMKAKMKQLFNEQMSVIKEKQREEVAVLEQELEKSRETLAKTSRSYEEHIRKLTTELWTVGEKFLMSKDEAEWLKRKQKSSSLMSLQHVHSSGLVPPVEEPSRPSDAISLRSLPANGDNKSNKEGRGLHMSDEEGEVFDNRWLKELSATPRREGRETLPPGQRLSELKWRNSLCPPHLKSSYPAETQFAPALDEEDIKCLGTVQGKQQRKEVGITAYKKPGPPTPSKQAGRLSATDSELRESLRVEGDPHASRKTSTPSRLRSLFRSSKAETVDGTPRSRRLSSIFRKK